MPKHREPDTDTPEGPTSPQGAPPREGPSVHSEDHDGLLDEIVRAQAEEAVGARVGRNDPCPCGSGRKYKKCCLERHRRLLSSVSPKELSSLVRLGEEKARCEERIKEGYELLGRREFEKALSFGQKWSRIFPHDDRFKDIMVTACLHLGRSRYALEIAEDGYREALEEEGQ